MGQLESFNPATGELVGTVETIKPEQVQGVVDEVAEVQPFWAQLTLADRGRYMRRAADVLVDDMEEVADLLTREQGKPLAESYVMELLPTIDALHWCADAGPKILADEKIRYPQALPEDQAELLLVRAARRGRRDRPLELPVVDPLRRDRDRADGRQRRGLQAGQPDAAARRADPAGLRRSRPPGGPGADGPRRRRGRPGALRVAPTAKIFFTGSVEVGRKVGEICAEQLKGSVLELGGKDPQIVCADADLANAVSGCVWGGFANAGQTCSGIERTYVVEAVADRFLDGVVRETERLTVGDPLDWETEIGPMVSAEQADAGHRAGRRRARRPAPSGSPAGPREVAGFAGRFIAPTVLAGVDDDMRIMREEIFGPVVPVIVVADEAEALERANDSELRARGFGLDRRTAPRASGSRAGSSRGWSGSTTTPTRMARPSARGAGSRTPASAARTRSSASTSA